MILALFLITSVGGLIIAIMNLIAACIVAVIQGSFEGLMLGLTEAIAQRKNNGK